MQITQNVKQAEILLANVKNDIYQKEIEILKLKIESEKLKQYILSNGTEPEN
jgi:hypothetical protein